MSFQDIFFGFFVALAAGALIGLERERSRMGDPTPRLGGVRTFPLIALSGALSSLASHTLGLWPILGALLVLGAFLTVSYAHEFDRAISPGMTTEVAALITFLLGVLALLPTLPLGTGQRYLLIVSSAGVVMALLSSEKPLHQMIARVSENDIYATARFVILALVVLPLLPNETFGPFKVLNPFNIGVMIVLIAGISYVGYLATRIIGVEKSVLVTGLVGGLVSSTAVTVTLSTRTRDTPDIRMLAAVGILTASATMCIRMLTIVGIVEANLLLPLLAPLGVMGMVGYAVALVFYMTRQRDLPLSRPVSHRNPFELAPALKFGLLYTAILFTTKAAQMFYGNQGLYLSSLLSGTTDVDAITLSIAQFHRDGLQTAPAATAITAAAITNTTVKAVLAMWLGGMRLAYASVGLLTMLSAGATALLFVWRF